MVKDSVPLALQRRIEEFGRNLSRKNDDALEVLKDCALASGAFWMCQNALQTVAGFIGIHSGRSLPILCSLGLLSTIASTSASMLVLDWTRKSSSWNWSFASPNSKHSSIFPFSVPSLPLPFSEKTSQASAKLQATRVMLGVGIFCMLELQGFKTALPSSIITTGVFARNRGSILATSEVATSAQRVRIQQLGWRHGCHHCGSRQVLSFDRTFIADHMPPTKFRKEMNAKWWRKLLGLRISQRLYPQCLDCFSLQGSAVKNFQHLPKYHFSPKLPHLAPAFAIVLSGDEVAKSIFHMLED